MTTRNFRLFIPALIGLAAIVLLPDGQAFAQNITIDLGEDADGELLGGTNSLTGRLIQLIAFVTVLSIAPGILVTVTSFTRIVVVLSLLRSALGTQTSPPNTVIISLALFLSAFVMAPTFTEAYEQGIKPLMEDSIDETEAFDRTVAPVRRFMLSQVREQDLRLFIDLSKSDTPQTAADTPLHALIPAFMVSELKRAFEIGFLIFIPFVVIDMVVASVLMSMGMMMLPPIMISLPFKLIFFVLVDGWSLIASSLVQSFGAG